MTTRDGIASSAGRASAGLSPSVETAHGVRLRAFGWRYALAAVTCVVFWFALLQQRPLWDPDEGRYAEIPREMVASGDWLSPRLNGLLYFEKPPLQYWATAAAYRVFGQENWTARLWSALTGLAGVLLALFAGARLHSMRAGIYAAAILASGVLYFGLTHLNTLDAGVSFFLELTIFSLALGLSQKTSRAASTAWLRAAWFAAALAVMSKGLIGFALPALALAIYAAVQRDGSIVRKAALPSGIAIFILTTAPWFIAVADANPGFLQFFFVHEHFTRFATTEHHRAQPWWFFVPVLAVGALPWTVAMLRGTWHALRERRRNDFDPFAFLAIWAAAVLVFFSASGSKLVPYVMPMLPALALIAARHLCQSPIAAVTREIFWCAGAGAAVLAAVGCVLAVRPGTFGPAAENIAAWWYFAAAALWVLAGYLALRLADERALDGSVVALVLALIAAHQLVFLGADAVAPHKTTASFAAKLKPLLGDATRVYVVRVYPQSLPFYLARTVTPVEFRGELDFGLQREPHKAIATLEAFRVAWTADTDAVAVMAKPTFETLRAAATPMTIIAEDAALVAVRRP